MILDGIWDFSFNPDVSWDEIRVATLTFNEIAAVPGCFDAQEIHRYRRGCGVYRRFVRCGGEQELEIGALGLYGRVFFDGGLIGQCDTPFECERFRFDAGIEKEHELVIVCCNQFDRTPSSQFHGYYDFYGFGGIYRSVRLTPTAEISVEHLQVIPRNHTDGTVEITAEIADSIPVGIELSACFDHGEEFRIPYCGNPVRWEGRVPNFRLWSPEQPNLHTFTLNGKSVTFGIRTVEAKDGKLYLNGEPIKLVGVCRHDSHPEFGYAMPESLVLSDLQMIKDNGFNCIRGSHYPQSEVMLNLCDRLGILVWDESLGWGNRIESLRDKEFIRRQLRQTRSMVRNGINHPSIVLWGFLNEAATNQAEARGPVKALIDEIHDCDRSRPVTFATMWQTNDQCLDLPDVISFNVYPGWYPDVEDDPFQEEFDERQIVSRLKKLADRVNAPELKDKAVIISEIGAEALPGNHGFLRWTEEYQSDLVNAALRDVIAHERYSGVLLWMFADTRTYSNGKGQERARGFNNKGLVDEYRRPKFSWLSIRKRLKN